MAGRKATVKIERSTGSISTVIELERFQEYFKSHKYSTNFQDSVRMDSPLSLCPTASTLFEPNGIESHTGEPVHVVYPEA